MERKLFIVANRLAVNVHTSENQITIRPNDGGLVTAVSSYLETLDQSDAPKFSSVIWAGVPGCNIQQWQYAKNENTNSLYQHLPVFIPKKIYDNYYNGFSNSVIWPLFHYFPSFAEYDEKCFNDYMQVNRKFADAILQQATPQDVIWIHDYHLMPLAAMLREEMPDLTIGFFLHIPFPSFEIIRLLPRSWQQALLKGMMGADLIGFHTIDYASYFLQTIHMSMGIDNDRHTITYNNRLIKVDVFPISINYKKFQDAADSKKVLLLKEKNKTSFKGVKIIFSVDRLDYTKGVYNRLKGYEKFLKDNPHYHNKIVFILSIVPSRDNIKRYAERKRMTDEYISSINGRIGNIHWQPVIYRYTKLDFHEMVALYNSCDVALITPLRDGMNLVAKEFIASRKDKKGVLILSEMAGAARELTEALIINPNDETEIADCIKQALEMPEKQQHDHLNAMQQRLKAYDVEAWAEDYLQQLHVIKTRQQQFKIKFMDDLVKRSLIADFSSAERKLLLLDYDGTLAPYASLPGLAKPDEELVKLLFNLSKDDATDVFIVSGRNSRELETWLGHLPISLIAEHGAAIKPKNSGWKNMISGDNHWIEGAYKIMNRYVQRCANSFIEQKDFSIVWHYRNAHQHHAKLRALELLSELKEFIHNRNLEIIPGNRTIELRNAGINKGRIVKSLLQQNQHDFILAAGDDRTDEDMFKQLTQISYAYSIKIGASASFAKYNLYSNNMLLSLLQTLQYYSMVQINQQKKPMVQNPV